MIASISSIAFYTPDLPRHRRATILLTLCAGNRSELGEVAMQSHQEQETHVL